MVMVPAGEQLPFLRLRIKYWVLFVLWLTLLATAGCDSPSSRPSSNGSEPRVEKLKTNFNVDEAREIAEPISSTPGLSVDTSAAQNGAIGSESFDGQMGAPKGLKTRRLFGTAAGSDDERFERLEAALQQLRDDFDNVSPSINRLIAIEGEIQTLVDQLNVLVSNGGNAPPPVETMDTVPIPQVPSSLVQEAEGEEFPEDPSVPEQSPPVPLAPPMNTLPPQNETPAAVEPPPMATTAADPAPPKAVPSPSGKSIVAARVADHSNSTRVVFETTADLPYSASVDPERILIVTFKSGTAPGGLAGTRINSDLIKSIDVTPQSNGGVIVAMPLASSAKILRQGVLKPDAENPNYRIYIDISK